MARDKSPVNLCTKYILFFWNFLIWLLGLALTGLGAYILVLKHKVVKDAIDFFLDPSTLMCTAGSIIVFLTFFGWFGALRENTGCLRAYNWMLSIIFFGELVLVTFVFVFYFVPNAKEKLGLFPAKTFNDAITKYGIVEDDDMKNLIDTMQETLGCCGFSDADDGFLAWNDNEYFNCTQESMKYNPEACSVPVSCCKIPTGELKNILCGQGVMKPSLTGGVEESDSHKPIYTVGCMKALGEFINDHALTIGGVMLGILLPQMFVMYLSRSLRDQVLAQKSKWERLRD